MFEWLTLSVDFSTVSFNYWSILFYTIYLNINKRFVRLLLNRLESISIRSRNRIRLLWLILSLAWHHCIGDSYAYDYKLSLISIIDKYTIIDK